MNKNDLRIGNISKTSEYYDNYSNDKKDSNNKNSKDDKKQQEYVYEELKRVVKKHAKENDTNIMELNFGVFLVKDGFTIKEAATIADIELEDLTNYIYKTLKKTNKEEYKYVIELLREREFVNQKGNTKIKK